MELIGHLFNDFEAMPLWLQIANVAVLCSVLGALGAAWAHRWGHRSGVVDGFWEGYQAATAWIKSLAEHPTSRLSIPLDRTHFFDCDCDGCQWVRERVDSRLLDATTAPPIDVTATVDATPNGAISPLQWAELLVRQLPQNHDGRNGWLIAHGQGTDVDAMRSEWTKETGRPWGQVALHKHPDADCHCEWCSMIDNIEAQAREALAKRLRDEDPLGQRLKPGREI